MTLRTFACLLVALAAAGAARAGLEAGGAERDAAMGRARPA